jgi:hypothetical protein
MENSHSSSKHYYLLDASAYCRFVEYTNFTHNAVITHDILQNALLDKYFYYIPQFCISEVFNTFAKWHYAQKSINYEGYTKITDFFKLLIRNRNIFYPYDLHR